MNAVTSLRILPVTLVGVALALSACTAPAEPAVTARQSASPTTSPAGTPAASTTPTTAPPTPVTASSRSSLDSLANATLDLPGWPPTRPSGPCPSGPTKFTKGMAGQLTKIYYAGTSDVDRDGAPDIVALIGCTPGEKPDNEAIAFHRNANGTVTTIGVIAAEADWITVDQTGVNGYDDKIHLVGDVHLHADGTVGVEVGNYETGFSEHAERGIWQTRTYRWDGHRFGQVAGPTSFNTPTWVHLSLTVSPMHFHKPTGGVRTGSITAKISNTGTRTVSHVSALLVLADSGYTLVGTGCTKGDVDALAEFCGDYSIAAGETVTLTLGLKISATGLADILANKPVDVDTVVQLRVDGLRSLQTLGLGRTIVDP